MYTTLDYLFWLASSVWRRAHTATAAVAANVADVAVTAAGTSLARAGASATSLFCSVFSFFPFLSCLNGTASYLQIWAVSLSLFQADYKSWPFVTINLNDRFETRTMKELNKFVATYGTGLAPHTWSTSRFLRPTHGSMCTCAVVHLDFRLPEHNIGGLVFSLYYERIG
jgi:hypothetical protein